MVLGDRAKLYESTKNWRFGPISRFISETEQYTATVTMVDEQELVCGLSNGAISNDLE